MAIKTQSEKQKINKPQPSITVNKTYPPLTPVQIVQELDKYIISQNLAKRSLAIALRNRWRRMNADPKIREEIHPSNILIIGPTGSGKTECARRLAKITHSPFVKVEATKYTKVGYVGGNVTSMVYNLIEKAISMEKKAAQEAIKEKAQQIVEDILLDILIPPMAPPKVELATNSPTATENHDQEIHINEQTRLRFREKIRKGDLDHRKIEIDIEKAAPVGGMGFLADGMMDESTMINFQNMMNKFFPKKKTKKTVTIAQAKEIFLEEQKNELVDMEMVKKKALDLVSERGIIFIDEIDKIAGAAGENTNLDVSGEGVQRDLLPIVEGSAVTTKYGTVHTDHILFIAAGAFHRSKPSDLIPELQGRFPIRVELQPLTQKDFFRILLDPKNSLIKQYQAMVATEGVALSFTKEAIEEIAAITFKINQEVENIGARRLHTVISHLLKDELFNIPNIHQGTKVNITKEVVTKRLAPLVEHKDSNRYIL